MRGEPWERATQARHRLRFGLIGVGPDEPTFRDRALDDDVPRGPGPLGKAVRAAQLGALRQGDEQRRLGEAEAPRLVAEIGQARGAYALQVAAVGCELEIAIEDAGLVQPPFEPDGAQHLPQLGAERTSPAGLLQPGHLHREGRAAGHDMAAAQHLERGSHQGVSVDALVAEEALVLGPDQKVDEARVDAGPVRGQPPTTVGCHEDAEHAPVAIDRGGGELDRRRIVEPGAEQRFPARRNAETEAEEQKDRDTGPS